MKEGYFVEFKNKNVLVCGMAKSGISAAVLLKKLGADVIIQDIKNKEELKNIDIRFFEENGIKLYLGKNPDDIVCNQDLIVVSPGIPCDLKFFEIAQKNKIPVWSEVELSYKLTPCPIVAITGTNGKTTTTALTGELIKSQYQNTAVVGNIGTPYSEKVLSLTKNDWVVAEISSFQMETSYEFKPKISAVLNIAPDHLNRHKTMENYIAMKERVFINQDKNDFCILNFDDAVCRKMADKTKARVLFFSSKSKLEQGIYLYKENIILKLDNKEYNIINVNDLKILGIHNYENVMAAVLAAYCAGISTEKISSVLKNFKGVEHRIEFVDTINGVDYFNDSKGTNTDAAIKAVEAMIKPIVLIGGGYDKGSDYDDWIKSFGNKVKCLVLLGETAEKIEITARKYGFNNIIKTNSFDEAFKEAEKAAEKGDCVLLSPACASWDMFDNYEQRGNIFKRKVKELEH